MDLLARVLRIKHSGLPLPLPYMATYDCQFKTRQAVPQAWYSLGDTINCYVNPVLIQEDPYVLLM